MYLKRARVNIVLADPSPICGFGLIREKMCMQKKGINWPLKFIPYYMIKCMNKKII